MREQYEELREDHYASLASRKFLTLEKAREKMLVVDWKPVAIPTVLATHRTRRTERADSQHRPCRCAPCSSAQLP